MIAYTFWQRILRAILLGVSIGTVLLVTAEGNDLPNDCAIVATEASARLGTSAAWSQVLLVKFIDVKTMRVSSHVMIAWQIHKDGAILIYDSDGTLPLDTHSQSAFDIAAAINKVNPKQPIFEAKFVQ